MKQILKKLWCALGVGLCVPFFANANGVESYANQSGAYLRNPSCNTLYSSPEAVFYNIAGTAFMADGIYVHIGNQLVFKEYTNEANGIQYTDDENEYLFPSFSAVYKSGKIAFFGSFAVYGGGGSLKYNDGSALTAGILSEASLSSQSESDKYTQRASSASDEAKAQKYTATAQKYAHIATALSAAIENHSLDVYSRSFGEQLGLSFYFNQYISASACFRLLQGQQNVKIACDDSLFVSANGGSEIGFQAAGWGYSFVLGVHAKPLEDLDVTVQYQTKNAMQYEYTRVYGELTEVLGYEKGSKFHSDFPAVWNLGIGYQLLDELYISANFNAYKESDIELNGSFQDGKYNDSFEVAIGADYQVLDFLLISIGGVFTRTGGTAEVNNIVNPALNAFSLGTGGTVKCSKNVSIELGGLYSYFIEQEYEGVILNKKALNTALAINIKPF